MRKFSTFKIMDFRQDSTFQKVNVLLTNDDGVRSEPMLSLARSLLPYARVTIVSPDRERSGISHAFTAPEGLRLEKLSEEPPTYSLSGTPADCVKFAVSSNLCETTPELIISGINLGENSGVSSLYSGTVAGAREGALWGLPSIAISLKGREGILLNEAIALISKIVLNRLFEQMPKGVFWNINFPSGKRAFRGVKVTSMALGMFTDHYENRHGLFYLEGTKDFENAYEGTDDKELSEGFATITPHTINQTAEEERIRIRQIDFN